MNQSFRQWIQSSATAKRFAWIVLLLCIGYYILETINGRNQMADFRVYYDAAQAFLYDTQLYGKSFGVSSGFYKYSPFACLPFIPLALLPYAIASVIYYLIISVCIVWFSLRLYFEISRNAEDTKHAGWILFLVALFMADHLERELHLGNVNLFLLIGTFQIYRLALIEKKHYAGLLFGLLLLFKPHFLILLPYFIWKKQWQSIFYTIAMVIIGLFIPALFKGFLHNNELLTQWLEAMREHNVSLQESPNTIYGILNHFVLQHRGGSMLVIILLAITGGLFVWYLIRNARATGNHQFRFLEFFILIALIPNLAHTDTEHFMWTWPLIAYVIIQLMTTRQRLQWLVSGMMILAFIPYCVNSPDIVGKEIRFLFDEGGLLGVSNLMIIASSLLISRK